MTSIVVSDAGPLIALGRIEQLNLLQHLYQNVLIPPAVHSELRCGADLPGATALRQAINEGWISVQNVPTRAKALSELRLILDAGESEAIVLAELVHCRFLLMDERRGRQVAKNRGWVYRTRDPNDRRKTQLELTPAGGVIYNRLQPFAESSISGLTSKISPAQEKQLHRYLD